MICRIWLLSVFYHISTYFLFFEHYFQYNIYAIILIFLYRTTGPFTLFILCYLQYICHFQVRYNRDYSRFSFDSISYSANITGKHCVFLINIHICKGTTLIFVLMWFGLLHWYNIQDKTGRLFLIVLHFVDRFVWDRSVFTQ